jgi:hypothetical protein
MMSLAFCLRSEIGMIFGALDIGSTSYCIINSTTIMSFWQDMRLASNMKLSG